MPTLTTTRTYVTGSILYKSDLDTFLNSIETFINTTKIGDSNIQGAGISGNLKLAEASISSAKILADAVITTKIADSAVTAEKINTDAVTTAKILDANVTTAKINDLAVTTAKILDANVTTAKIANGTVTVANLATSIETRTASDIAAAQAITTSIVDLTNSATTITATGVRPILIIVRNNSSGSNTNVFEQVPETTGIGDVVAGIANLYLYKNSVLLTQLGGFRWFMNTFGTGSMQIPATFFNFIDTTVSAGSNEYKLAINNNTGTTTYSGFKLYVREL
jgi:hypothetical protein